MQEGVLLNPGGLLLRAGDKALLLARSIQDARKAVTVKFEQVQPAVQARDGPMHSLEEGSFCDVSGEGQRCSIRDVLPPLAPLSHFERLPPLPLLLGTM